MVLNNTTNGCSLEEKYSIPNHDIMFTQVYDLIVCCLTVNSPKHINLRIIPMHVTLDNGCHNKDLDLFKYCIDTFSVCYSEAFK